MQKLLILTYLLWIVLVNVKSQSDSSDSSINNLQYMADSAFHSFDLDNSFVDNRDNHKYNFVDIDSMRWMAQNLNFKSQQSLVYNNQEKYADVFGRLYNWKDAACACPDGWRLPTEKDWQKLESFLGLDSLTIDSTGWRGSDFGNILKSKDKKAWLSDYHLDAPDIGFNAVAGGVAFDSNNYANIGLGSYFWSSTKYYSTLSWSRYLSYENGEIFRNISAVNWYFSIRCVKE